MKTDENYRPAHIEFDVATDGSLMPETFGEFENAETASKFMGGNMVIINQPLTVSRHMDHVEKKLLREQYENVLENILPVNEKKYAIATNELAEAKRKEKEALETVNATITEVKCLAQEVKRGLKEMNLDENFTYKVPFKGRFYCYTYIDKAIRLVKIYDIPEHERGEIFSSDASNQEFIENNFGKKDEQTSA